MVCQFDSIRKTHLETPYENYSRKRDYGNEQLCGGAPASITHQN